MNQPSQHPSFILIIEDDADIQVSFKQTLESHGHTVVTVENGWDALNILAKMTPPDLIIADLSMPIMNGEEFLRLKNDNPKLAPLPVLVVSSFQDRLNALSQYPTLKKPVDMDEFASKVGQCLKANKK